MRRVRTGTLLVSLLPLALLCPSLASAVSLGTFGCITNNNAGDCSIGTSQLSGEVVANGADALLTIQMTGTDSAVVEQLFIESTTASGLSFVVSTGLGQVAFGAGAAGGNLPGGNQPGVNFTSAWNSSADNPKPNWGIGWHSQDEFSPQAGQFRIEHSGSFEDFVAGLRVGVHVIGYTSGGSESFTSEVPEPGSGLAFVSGFLTLAAVSRQRRGDDSPA